MKYVRLVFFFSIIADEASDQVKQNNFPYLCVYVDSISQIREEFVGFVECELTSAETLSLEITSFISDLSLDVNYVRGQCYDGAAKMAGEKMVSVLKSYKNIRKLSTFIALLIV